MPNLDELRSRIRAATLADEAATVARLKDDAQLSPGVRAEIGDRALKLVEKVRSGDAPGMLESFLAEYSLSTGEGIALMCLAEALLRVPDTRTIDDLIEDKIGPSRWAEHLDRANSPLVNVSTLALTLTGEVLRDGGAGIAGTIKSFVQRIGEPVIRSAVMQAMKILGSQFVLGRDIEEATKVARRAEKDGFTYSYDMLGEAARTEADAKRYRAAYAEAIAVLATRSTAGSVRDNPGVSVKLSALHPRYEFMKRDRVMDELVERVLALAMMARGANMGFNIDAEEADRLDLSLDVIAAVLADERLAGWDGFGIVVQAYGQRASLVIDWIEALAEQFDRRVMVRLVKGAYWDSEIKRAQVLGLGGFPVFTRKPATDVSFIANARRLLSKTSRIYPQFATHNAHTVAAVLQLAESLGIDNAAFEFQRLHGMGERLHQIVHDEHRTRTRIYAPVGRHADLLAYLVRRLLENGANGSFVNMIADRDVPAADVVRDPFDTVETARARVRAPSDLFEPARRNSRGRDLSDPLEVEYLLADRDRFRPSEKRWHAVPASLVAGSQSEQHSIVNPATGETVGDAIGAGPETLELAIATARDAAPGWAARPVAERALLLRQVADLYEDNAAEFYALCAREAGKTLADAVSEVREAVDFLRYYAAEAEASEPRQPLGVFTCISPWNFPLSIFTGQVAAALVAGNTVLAKPAEATPLIAALAVRLMYQAGIPEEVVQLVPGAGSVVGAALTSDPRIDGVCFTGSLATGKSIDVKMADHLAAGAALIAETGGLNAMIVDSTALPEQAVRDILSSAFQSAGQRCSALRMLYIQEDAAERTLEMLYGAMDELQLGDPWDLSVDVGPVIDQKAKAKMEGYIAEFHARDAVLHQVPTPQNGTFVAPTVLRVSGIAEMKEEIFGPVLHVATFKAEELDAVIAAINASGYGLTFGLHTRIDGRVEDISQRIRAGNIYVNRNQIGAVVGSQPFGGEGLSGTGPKAGGPNYLKRFWRPPERFEPSAAVNPLSGLSIGFSIAAVDQVRTGIERVGIEPARETLPGPTGESNTLYTWPRGVVLCLGPDTRSAEQQARLALEQGNGVLVVAPGATRIAEALGANGEPIGGLDKKLSPAAIEAGLHVDAIMHFGTEADLRPWRQALSRRDGVIVPLITRPSDAERLITERHVCIDTTASGGNAELLAGQ
ncbi:MAG: bifunctional proline dehydrogenase/L-glutamate gamma-semialdehyde dehydrogenase [Devosia sp.]|uniref:bifunctional proline dehydrogenase/L-glutamate gamma-semialdehyde dehydrogenase PutA n=1 Tax=Devosia sp. TaxID=1871048 RepID=UPI002606439E|nr:bifunctional proline dehydrogenase/L-glutamate gamma-semialdehyde dehydrogenase PutA [Devosia sp.]MDB5541797.1 bifunctional proline dehydrogenase/L-glutamate gamma-semialdehyde dehydrogenase [Devosia sp.]